MSDSAAAAAAAAGGGGGEGGGGTAGAGQDAEADSEPPLLPPPPPEVEGAAGKSEEAAFPAAKRLKISEAIKGPLQPEMPQKAADEVNAQTDPLQEEDVPPGQGKVSAAV